MSTSPTKAPVSSGGGIPGGPVSPLPAVLSMSERLNKILNAAIPVDADEFFQFADNICIMQGENAQYESFVVKCSVDCLEKGNVLMVFYDPSNGNGGFADFELHGFALKICHKFSDFSR